MQEVEVTRAGELLRLADAGGEVCPGQNRLDRGEGIAALVPGLQQGLADATVQPDLVVDGLARGLELLLVLVPGGAEQPAQ